MNGKCNVLRTQCLYVEEAGQHYATRAPLVYLFVVNLPFLLQIRESNMKGHSDSVDQLCWHPSHSDLLVTASGDKTIRVWDARGNDVPIL